MENSELVFIAAPGVGHLTSTLELAKLLIHRDHGLSITILIMNLPFETKKSQTPTSTDPRLTFITLPQDDSAASLFSPHTFLSAYIEHQKPYVRDIVRGISESGSVRLAGFVVDMFCAAMTDVAHEFGCPTYVYFTSGAAMLGLMFRLQALRDEEGRDVTELDDGPAPELELPSFANPVPGRVLPAVVLDKQGGSNMFLDLAKRFREAKGIMVNTFEELEPHAIESFLTSYTDVPPLFPVGPILNLKSETNDDVMGWLDEQPRGSVVFLCFGSMGSFGEEQVKEIAVALELSGHRFLWSHRRPPPKDKIGAPGEYENPDEVLPEGFLERTSNIGKVIGWAPQVAVLSHPAVGGFVSHCGWNSTLESVWCGVPLAAWPVYAEQQLNAFQMVVELGMAAEIKMDYRREYGAVEGKVVLVTAAEIENGIRRLMGDDEMRKKVKEMGEKSRSAVSEGGTSYTSIQRFIEHVIVNTP